MLKLHSSHLAQGLVWLWGMWMLIVTCADWADLGQNLGFFPKSWSFTSHNYALVNHFTEIYHFSSTFNVFIFISIVCWITFNSFLYLKAMLTSFSHPYWFQRVLEAFGACLFLHAVFF